MANLPDGTYIIHNCAATSQVLDVTANQTVNGTNIQVWTRNNTDAQVWEVSTRRDGTRQILNRFSGKSIDVLAAQISTLWQNIQLFDDNDTIAQQWRLVDANTPITYNGVTYASYYLQLNSGYVAHMAYVYPDYEGSNVCLQTKWEPQPNSNLQQWFFEPVPLLRDGGVYEIRTYLNTKMGLEVVGGTANGANVQLNYASDKNTMKFVLAQESTGWSFYNAATGKYVDVDSALAVAGTNIQQWDDNDTRAQRWKIITYGDTIVGGVKCLTCRLGSYVTGDGQTYMMDVSKSDSSAGNNIQIWGALNNDAQLFVLVPSNAEDVSMPVPYDLGIARGVNYVGMKQAELPANGIVYPCWQCSAAWQADNNNHYEIRWRRRFMRSTTSSWTAWESWTQWSAQGVTKSGTRTWMTQGIDCSYSFTNYKNAEIEFQVRAVGTDEYKMLHSKAADVVCQVCKKPTVSVQSALFSPEGLRIQFNNDYTCGATKITLWQVIDGAGDWLLSNPVELEVQSALDSDLVDISMLQKVPANNTFSAFSYAVGNDQRARFNESQEDYKTITYNGGNYLFTPILVEQGNRLYAVILGFESARCWVTDGKQLLECALTDDYVYPDTPGIEGMKYWVFDVPYAMNKTNVIYATTVNAAETQYGVSSKSWTNTKRLYAFSSPEGHSVFLHRFADNKPTMSRSGNSVYQSDVLDAREHESVSFNGTVKSNITIYGDLLSDDESTIDDFIALEGKHVTFRDFYGDIWPVAITKIEYTRANNIDHVTVSMIEETR